MMQYLGGKSKIAVQISSIINTYVSGRPFVSLFCGSCAIESKVEGQVSTICNDAHPYLIAMWRACQSGRILPDTVTETQYRYIRQHLDEDPALSGFVGFACSFSGKWFGGYARCNGIRNYALEGKKSVLRDVKKLYAAFFTCLDYRDVPIPSDAVVYADPPYIGVSGYSLGHFDTGAFWDYMRCIARGGATVFISEQSAPRDFVCIWEKPITRTVDRNKDNQIKVIEKLFTYGGVR